MAELWVPPGVGSSRHREDRLAHSLAMFRSIPRRSPTSFFDAFGSWAKATHPEVEWRMVQRRADNISTGDRRNEVVEGMARSSASDDEIPHGELRVMHLHTEGMSRNARSALQALVDSVAPLRHRRLMREALHGLELVAQQGQAVRTALIAALPELVYLSREDTEEVLRQARLILRR